MESKPPQLGGLGSPRTYTYTDAELQSLLTCVLDEGHAGLEGLVPMGGGGLQGGHSLQFLPHLPIPSGAGAADHEPAVFIPTDLSGAQPMDGDSQLQPPLLPPLRVERYFGEGPQASAFSLVGLGPGMQQQQQQRSVTLRSGVQRPPPRAAAVAARASSMPASSAAAAAKQPHSIVEKQRRDRINHLIDELRELVPPQSGDLVSAAGQDALAMAGDARRPKHVVLSDAIRLIKDLQLQLAEMQLSPHSDSGRHWQQQQQQAALSPEGLAQLQPSHWPTSEALQSAYAPPPSAAFGQQAPLQLAQQLARLSPQGQLQGLSSTSLARLSPQGQLQRLSSSPLAPPALARPSPPMPLGEPHPTAATHHNNAVPQLVAAASDQQTRSGSAQASGSRLSGEGPHPELPLAPDDDAASEAGVVVECEEGAIRYVKVTCPDRHGLLSDVVRALRELPLEITTAAITTRRDHVVYDVFQVEVQNECLTPDELRAAVEAALRIPADKKKRKQDCQEALGSQLLLG